MPKQDQRQISQVRASQYPDWRGRGSLWTPICVWTWPRYGRRVGVTAQSSRSKRIGRMKKSFALIVLCTCTDFSHSHYSCRRSFRQRLRGERAIITSTMRLSHGLSSGMSLHEHCPPSAVRNAAAAHDWGRTVLSSFNKITFSRTSRPSDAYFCFDL